MSFLSVQGTLLVCAFLIGSIPFGVIMARAFQVKDLTEQGSGNIGASNVARVVGLWPAGVLTFLLDMIKGVLPVFIVAFTAVPTFLAEAMGLYSESSFSASPTLIWSTALFAVLGHCFSPWLHFRGGKGVASGFGAVLVLSPISAFAGLMGYAFSFFTTRVSSLSSLTGLALASVTYLMTNSIAVHVWAGAGLVFVILIRHEPNLDALLAGTEKKLQ